MQANEIALVNSVLGVCGLCRDLLKRRKKDKCIRLTFAQNYLDALLKVIVLMDSSFTVLLSNCAERWNYETRSFGNIS